MNSLPPEKMSEAEEARRKATPFFQRLRVLLTSPNSCRFAALSDGITEDK